MKMLEELEPGVVKLVKDSEGVLRSRKSGENWVREATGVLVGMSRVKKMLEVARKEAVGPLKEEIKGIEGPIKGVLEKIGEFDSRVRGRVMDEHQGTGKVVVEGAGELTFTQPWTYEVECVEAMPSEYLTVDSGAIRTEIRNGVREIPGIKIYQSRVLNVKPEKSS